MLFIKSQFAARTLSSFYQYAVKSIISDSIPKNNIIIVKRQAFARFAILCFAWLLTFYYFFMQVQINLLIAASSLS